MKYFLTILSILLIPGISTAGRLHPESYYQKIWCAEKNGQAEVVLPDRTRCDCITETHSIEVDFAPKFYQAIGQSLYYSLQTGKQAGIVLILEKQSDYKYWIRLKFGH